MVELCRRVFAVFLLCGFEGVEVDDEVLVRIVDYADGDGWRVLNFFELVVQDGDGKITCEIVDGVRQEMMVGYDCIGDMYYDVVSVLIKLMCVSDPDATFYYFACMIEVGEEFRFIFW